MTARGTLLTIGSNPPSETSGQRTLARVELARRLLGYEHQHLANLFVVPTYRTGGLSEAGATEEGWLAARPDILASLRAADAVLLAYGITAPNGTARQHFQAQVAWLADQLREANLPVWWVGGEPRHPSRWQRFTYRMQPGVPFGEALATALEPASLSVHSSGNTYSSPKSR